MADMDMDFDTEEGNVDVAPAPVKAKRKAMADTPKVRKMTRILLEESNNIPETGLYLGHNGKGFLLKPGVQVDVPPEIIEILDHAVQSIPTVDPQNFAITGMRDQMKYPYRVINT